MKIKTTILSIFIAFVGIMISNSAKAQDTIVKTNGEVIYGKVLEVGTNGVSYKKAPIRESTTYVDNKKDIAYIRFHNGEKQLFATTTVPVLPNSGQTPTNTVPMASGDNGYLKSGPVSNQYKIDHIDKKFTINGQKAGIKDVDRLLAKSTNPAVQVAAKTAKATKIAQKIIKLTSIGTTVGGGFTSVATISQFVTAYQTKTLTPKYYVNAGVSLLGTMSLPITSKILKNRRDKLYDKAIDLYNLKN